VRSALARADFAEDDHDQGGFDAFATEHTEHVERERFYLPAVDILRFLAFFAVFSFHFSPLPVYRWQPSIARSIVSAGQFGVDLFFALSAYLITRLLLSERATSGELHIGSFYARRILRIWPLYFFFLCLAALLSYWRFLPGAFETRPIYFITFFAFVGNFTCSYLGYPQFFLAPLWSISVEEQFYLL